MNLEISSKENFSYKELKNIIKEQNDFVIAEGKKLFSELVNSSLEIKRIYIDKENENMLSDLLPSCKKCEIIFIKNHLLATIFTTNSKPKSRELIIALASKPQFKLKDLTKEKKNLIYLEKIQDPGNLGVIIRSALAFGAGGVILSSGSLDPLNTKSVRASAGAIFKLPVITNSSFKDLSSIVKDEKYKIIATSPKGKSKISDLDFTLPYVFLFGNEGSGLSEEVLSFADEVVSIPHSKETESLNLGISAGLVLWEAYKEK